MSSTKDPINNTTYIPHTVKRSPPVVANQSKKQTTFSVKKFSQIGVLASDTPVVDQRAEIYKDRLALHNKSQAKVKNWGNTIWGARLQRLAATEEKERLLELERQKVDAEWAKVMEAEKAAFIDRARMLQMFEDPRVRSLHSQLLMSNVLKERDLQLEYKKKKNLEEKIEEKEEVLRMRQSYLQGVKDDKLKTERETQKRLDFANGLKAGVVSNQGKSGQHKADQASIGAVAAKIAEEYRKEKIERQEKKKKEALIMRKVLAVQLLQKKAKKTEEVMELQELEENNQRFNNMKYTLGEKRKDIIKQQAIIRMQRSEVVAGISKKEIEVAEKARADFLKAMEYSTAVQGRSDQKKATVRQAFIKDKEAFERQHKLKKEAIRVEGNNAKALEKKKYELEAEIYVKECKEKEEKKRTKLMAIKNEQLEQMKRNAEKSDVHQEETAKYDNYNEKKQEAESKRFEEYSSKCIADFAKEGKNVKILMNAIEKENKRIGARPKPKAHISQIRFT